MQSKALNSLKLKLDTGIQAREAVVSHKLYCQWLYTGVYYASMTTEQLQTADEDKNVEKLNFLCGQNDRLLA